MKVILGNNVIENCDAALILNGVEVFRLRERGGDGQLVVDFDIRGQDGQLIAKVAKNNVVHAAEGYRVIHGPDVSMVVQPATKLLLASVQEVGPGTVRVIGDFWVDGLRACIGPDYSEIGGAFLAGNHFYGFGTALKVSHDSLELGSNAPHGG